MGLCVHNLGKTVAAFSQKDADVLRTLAKRVAQVAALEEQKEKRKLWYALNSLKPIRPLVFCDPENGWYEIIPESDCQCEGELARNIEHILRKELFWGENMGDDKVVDATFSLPHVYTSTGWGLPFNFIGEEYGHAYTWEPPLKDYDTDLLKMRLPKFIVDHESSNRLLALVQEVLEPHLRVQLKTAWWWSFGLTREMVWLRGMERFFYDIFDYPEKVHEAMGILRDGYIGLIDALESEGLLLPNGDNTYVGSGGFGFTDELPMGGHGGVTQAIDMWGHSESQETVSMSAAMFEEFVFQYQYPILQKFGLNCYGCCEPVDSRWDVIKRTPNLRRVSISPWSDTRVAAEQLGDRYVYSYKHAPACLATPNMDISAARSHLRSVLDAAKGCTIELIMKDNNTIGKNPQNVIDWCKVAKEEACR